MAYIDNNGNIFLDGVPAVQPTAGTFYSNEVPIQNYQQQYYQPQPFYYQNQWYYPPQPINYNTYQLEELRDDYGPIFGPHANIMHEYYYQRGYNYNPEYTDQYGRMIPLRTYTSPFIDYYSGYQAQQAQQQELREAQQKHQATINFLMKIEFGEEGLEQKQKQYQELQEQQMLQQKEAEQYQELNHIFWLSSLPNSITDPNYNSNRVWSLHVTRWNKLAERDANKIPENTPLKSLLNDGYLTTAYVDTLKYYADKKAKDLMRLYDRSTFRSLMADADPTYDPIQGLFKRRQLALDDLTITLPPEIANTDYNKRRERFMAAILRDPNVT